MKPISGYTILERVDETTHSIVFRARKEGENRTVIIKALRALFPSPSEISRLKHEHELIRSITIPGIIRVFEVIDIDGGPAIVMEDFGGVPLKEFIVDGFTLEHFLDLAIRLSVTLGGLHQANITHRDIKPRNILFNRAENILKITDFGIAAEITRQNEEIYSPKVIEGTLAYISPEQTGRMNCAVDYRTDLYSLGVSFYEMLLGKVPFMSRDPMEIIHAHIAKQPLAPHGLNQDIPEQVSDIVMKLLSKSPEDRYQNAFGLAYDLKECLARLHNTGGQIELFALGARDISPRFNMPQILVGREEPQAVLFGAFERISNGAFEIMLVAGEPGIGKTALINQIHKPVVGRRGYFIAGKFDPNRKHVPYSAIIQAFRDLARQLLAESEERIRQWRAELLRALGPNGKVITDSIPDIERIIGKQPDIPNLGFEESRNRFNLVVKNFFRVFAKREHPLVLFLDDLQWADPASLTLLGNVTQDKSLANVLFIGAYRKNEVSPDHPLIPLGEEIRKAGIVITVLSLDVLTEVEVNNLIANFLRCDPATSAPLAAIVHAKTRGNPFFVNQFLKTLYEERYLILDPSLGWRWDVNRIREMQVTDNVVELMASKIVRLPSTGLELIQVCACVGNRFGVETPAAVLNRSIDEALYSMDELIRHGFINYADNVYTFHHDRIREAAYSLLRPEKRRDYHYKIARQVLEMTPAGDLPAKLFFIADQFNHAQELIRSREEKDLVLELDFKAGLKAKDTMAYDTAADYLRTAIELLPEDGWQGNYDLTFNLHLKCMECEYLSRNFTAAQRLFIEITHNAKNKNDRARACRAMIELYTNIGKFKEAIELGVECARVFGVRLNLHAGKLDVVPELIRLKLNLRKIPIKDILDLPLLKNEEKYRIGELLGSIGTPAYYVNPHLFAVTALKGINMVLNYGQMPISAFGFVAIASILGQALGEYRTAYRIGKMALSLSEKLNDKAGACKVHFLFGFLILHWFKPIKECIPCYRKAYQFGIDSGDFMYTAFCISAINFTRIFVGDNVDEVLADHIGHKGFLESVQDPFTMDQYNEVVHFCLNLKGLTESLCSLTTKDYNQEEHLEKARRQGNLLDVFAHLQIKERLHYLYGRYDESCRIGDELDGLLEATAGAPHLWEHVAQRCQSLLAALPGKPPAERRRMLGIVKKMHRKLKRWSKFGSVNIIQKNLLVEAELAAVTGHEQAAVEGYHRAVKAAHEHGLVFDEAIANERAAYYYLGRGLDEIARAYMTVAYHAYHRWGASAKIRELERDQADLIMRETKLRPGSDTTSTVGSIGMNLASNLLDLSTVMQTSQAISGEIVLDRLIQKVMKIAVANAGAQRGVFILNSDGKLTIEADEETQHDTGAVMQSIPLESFAGLCRAIVHYVHRSGQSLILDNASQDGAFMHDEYIATHRIKSIMCAPIKHQSRITGILYMENNLTANAFTPERLEFIGIIAAQAAISLENAKLYELATTDGLTKLYVHRYFKLLLDQEIQRSRRYNKTFSLIMMDIDDFKHFNDTYGHQLGDEVLKSVARAIKKDFRAEDIAARYGGEEFIMVLPETDTTQAVKAAEKIRAIVQNMNIAQGGKILHVTISLGVATFPKHAMDGDRLIKSADEALYESKGTGKNRVSVGKIADG